MGKKVFLGVSSKAHTCKKLYLGVSGKAHKVKKGFIGVGNKAHQFYNASTAYPGFYRMVSTGGNVLRRYPASSDLGTANYANVTLSFNVRSYSGYYCSNIGAMNDRLMLANWLNGVYTIKSVDAITGNIYYSVPGEDAYPWIASSGDFLVVGKERNGAYLHRVDANSGAVMEQDWHTLGLNYYGLNLMGGTQSGNVISYELTSSGDDSYGHFSFESNVVNHSRVRQLHSGYMGSANKSFLWETTYPGINDLLRDYATLAVITQLKNRTKDNHRMGVI